jgi:hypothetical protein
MYRQLKFNSHSYENICVVCDKKFYDYRFGRYCDDYCRLAGQSLGVLKSVKLRPNSRGGGGKIDNSITKEERLKRLDEIIHLMKLKSTISKKELLMLGKQVPTVKIKHLKHINNCTYIVSRVSFFNNKLINYKF